MGNDINIRGWSHTLLRLVWTDPYASEATQFWLLLFIAKEEQNHEKNQFKLVYYCQVLPTSPSQPTIFYPLYLSSKINK